MKLNVLFSILFAIVTSFAAIHEVEHITHDMDESSACLVCTLNNNFLSADIIDFVSDAPRIYFEEIIQKSSFVYKHIRTTSNQNRAPPALA